MTALLRLDIYSHNIKITEITQCVRKLVIDFILTLGHYELRQINKFKWEKELKKLYATRTVDKLQYRIHRHSYNDFIHYMSDYGVHVESFDIVHHVPPKAVKVKFTVIDKREPRDGQAEIIEYLSKDQHIKALTLQTGKGKTFCANHAINNIGERTVIIIKGMYVDRWLTDINETFKIEKGDILVVRGTKDMINLILLAQHNQLDAKIIIITNTTFRMFIDDYEVNMNNNMYGCNPEDFFGIIGAGIRLIDEVHQDFHLNFKIDLYTNIKTSINLSATLNANNPFTNKMYELAYPTMYRPESLEYDKYIAVKAYIYRHTDIRKIRHKQRGRNFYNHVVYEESIMKNPVVYRNYVNMIADITLKDFIQEWEPGQRFIIFCATKEFCTRLTDVLKRKFPNMDIGRYIGEDEAKVYKENDIIVSTLKSAGTAVDIPGLKKALLTIAVDSRQANEQAVGRLRKMKDWPDVTPEFIYLVCNDIDKHRDYHKNKREVLYDKILSHKEFYTPYYI